MPAKLQFIAPESKNPISIAFSEPYKRMLRNFENNGYLKVERPDFHDIRQMRHWANRSIAKPEHISTKILRKDGIPPLLHIIRRSWEFRGK